jgi:hypothetical protein
MMYAASMPASSVTATTIAVMVLTKSIVMATTMSCWNWMRVEVVKVTHRPSTKQALLLPFRQNQSTRREEVTFMEMVGKMHKIVQLVLAARGMSKPTLATLPPLNQTLHRPSVTTMTIQRQRTRREIKAVMEWMDVVEVVR